VVHQASRDQSQDEVKANQAIPGGIIDIANFCTRYDCHAVTLTFDLLTLNFYSTSYVVRINSVQNLSEIEQSTAELLMI